MDDSRHVYHQGFPIHESSRPSLFYRLMRTKPFLILWTIYIMIYSTLPVVFLTFYVCALALLRVVGHRKLRTFSDWSIKSWLVSMCFITRYILGIKVRIFGDDRRFDKRCLIILNHRCHLDWLFFWLVTAKIGNLARWIVILKRAMKIAPILGWTMQYRNYLFMSRDWARDKDEFTWKLHYLNSTDEHYQLLLFPEGTDLTPEHKEKSDQFADQKNLPHTNYTLHPKSTGFLYTMKLLRQGKLESVYDMSVAYPDVFAPTELEIFQGIIPHEVHYHVKRYDLSELPETDEELEAWLRKRWEEKEERLRQFYKHRRFIELPIDVKERGANFKADDDQVTPSPEVGIRFPWLQLLEGMLFQTLLIGGSLLWCWYSWWGYIAVVISCVFNGYFCTYRSRMDYIIMNHYRKNCEEFLPHWYLADKKD